MDNQPLEHEQPLSYDRGTIKTSETIKDLAIALATAQMQIDSAKKGSTNPHFRSKYADLASVWDACREALTKNGLSVVQIPESKGNVVNVTTMLLHKSGQFISGSLTMISKQDTPQAIGSCITYARRYSLAAFVGIAPDDDDGNAASEGAAHNRAASQSRRSNQGGSKPSEPSRHDKTLAAFKDFDIGQEVLEKHIGKEFKKFTKADFDKCGILWGELKAGNITADEIPTAIDAEKQKLEQVFKK